jgi:hypothetical protein
LSAARIREKRTGRGQGMSAERKRRKEKKNGGINYERLLRRVSM